MHAALKHGAPLTGWTLPGLARTWAHVRKRLSICINPQTSTGVRPVRVPHGSEKHILADAASRQYGRLLRRVGEPEAKSGHFGHKGKLRLRCNSHLPERRMPFSSMSSPQSSDWQPPKAASCLVEKCRLCRLWTAYTLCVPPAKPARRVDLSMARHQRAGQNPSNRTESSSCQSRQLQPGLLANLTPATPRRLCPVPKLCTLPTPRLTCSDNTWRDTDSMFASASPALAREAASAPSNRSRWTPACQMPTLSVTLFDTLCTVLGDAEDILHSNSS